MLKTLFGWFGGSLWGYVILSAMVAAASISATAWIKEKERLADVAAVQSKLDNLKATSAEAALKQLTGLIANIKLAGDDYATLSADLKLKLANVSKEMRDAIKARPLPPGCVPDAARMRPLANGIATVNGAAAGPAPSR